MTRLTLAALTLFTAPDALASASDGHAPQPTTQHAPQRATHAANVREACPTAAPGHVRCMAQVRTDVHGGRGVKGRAAQDAHAGAGSGAAATALPTALPTGYGPADLHSAYNLPFTGGSGQTVAVVDSFDDPNAEADLAVYRATYGLPACTTADGCFSKVGQDGTQGDYPPADTYTGWSLETSLDLDAVSAVCQDCHILLVEANSTSVADLAAAENTAARLGATEISNSYGEDESYEMLPYESAYSHPGVAITVASGDLGFTTPMYPAVLPSVTAVGGTSLQRDPSTARGWSETAWDMAGSGCSAWVDKPAWQTDVPDCPGRVTADVSADADPNTGGLAIYDTVPDLYGYPGWMEEGGTSLASPIVAAVIALAGNPGDLPDASHIYQHAGS